mmetsp:Transcript_6892/g.16009  ORF Transcript_6892/g.16009 Transcript_6892/m.16009 type:complete len:181 (+) Transcript_6892:1167-1709(+)
MVLPVSSTIDRTRFAPVQLALPATCANSNVQRAVSMGFVMPMPPINGASVHLFMKGIFVRLNGHAIKVALMMENVNSSTDSESTVTSTLRSASFKIFGTAPGPTMSNDAPVPATLLAVTVVSRVLAKTGVHVAPGTGSATAGWMKAKTRMAKKTVAISVNVLLATMVGIASSSMIQKIVN